MKVAIVIPAYNEEENIGALLDALERCDLEWNKEEVRPQDVIVVDDGSTDKTGEIASRKAILLKHEHNLGKGYAHRTGFKYAVANGYDYVITIDGDNQHNPEEIPIFIKEITKNERDIIIGTRKFSLNNMPLIRVLTNILTSFVVSLLSHKRVKDSQSGYRAISTKVLQEINLATGNFQTESELLIKAARIGYRIGSVPICTIYSEEKSKINPFIDTVRFIILSFKGIWR